mmetsp:Transcript_27490/g.31790  ORF Transcript_27490/g.31790 Transcript_27490/m.31790 type:complete len:93 (-) Transcript_27490:135-413(-)
MRGPGRQPSRRERSRIVFGAGNRGHGRIGKMLGGIGRTEIILGVCCLQSYGCLVENALLFEIAARATDTNDEHQEDHPSPNHSQQIVPFHEW